jgi:hypothetical protein
MKDANPFSAFPFVPVDRVSGQNWQRPRSFAFATTLAHLPLADSEVLQTAHHLPIAIAEKDDGLHVVALPHAGLTRISPVAEDGRWRRSYMPIALRCLPFRLASPSGPAPRLEIAPDLGIAPPGVQGARLTTTTDVLQADLQPMASLLTRLESGHRRLNRAAERLFLTGVLAVIEGIPADYGAYLTVNPQAFEDLAPEHCAFLARDHFLPMDLIAACLFSRRLLPDHVARLASAPKRKGPDDRSTIATEVNDLLRHVNDVDMRIDDSELFSIDAFS